MVRVTVFPLLFSLSSQSGFIHVQKHRTKPMHGHIVAFHPAELVFQAVSFVQNSENYLLEYDDRKGAPWSRCPMNTFGYSEISSEMRDAVLVFPVYRDRSCDETYEHYAASGLRILGSRWARDGGQATLVGEFHGLPAKAVSLLPG